LTSRPLTGRVASAVLRRPGSREFARLQGLLERVTEAVALPGLDGRPATVRELEWLLRRSLGIGLASPRSLAPHDEPRWEAARRPAIAAVDADGDFLDVGCANGYLMESIHRWAAEDGFAIEPYGLDLSAGLADLARRRLPQWADRIWVGNALYWQPPRRFDYVRTALDYVPAGRVVDLVNHLMEAVVDRRLIIGVMNEARDRPWRAQELVEAGYTIAGRREWLKPSDPRVVRRVCWIDCV
jgi:hypothetical protein